MRKMSFVVATILLIMIGVLPLAVIAQEDLIDGQVTKIDESAGKITIRHGPIKKFDMDNMTMVFRVNDLAMLKAVKVGDKVKFDPDRVNGQFTVMKIEKVN